MTNRSSNRFAVCRRRRPAKTTKTGPATFWGRTGGARFKISSPLFVIVRPDATGHAPSLVPFTWTARARPLSPMTHTFVLVALPGVHTPLGHEMSQEWDYNYEQDESSLDHFAQKSFRRRVGRSPRTTARWRFPCLFIGESPLGYNIRVGGTGFLPH